MPARVLVGPPDGAQATGTVHEGTSGMANDMRKSLKQPTPVQRIVVAAAIVVLDRVLLAKRAGGKSIAPGKWHLPGGHVEFGERPEEALRRELAEELGVVARVGMPVHAFSYLCADVHTVGIAYLAALEGDALVIRPNPRDFDSTQWVVAADLGHFLPADDHNFIAAERALRMAATAST